MCFVKRGTYEGGVSLIKSARACREIEGGGDGRRLVCCAPRSRARRALARAQFVDSLYLSGPSSASVHCVSMLVPACGSRADTVSASASIRLGPSRPSHHKALDRSSHGVDSHDARATSRVFNFISDLGVCRVILFQV